MKGASTEFLLYTNHPQAYRYPDSTRLATVVENENVEPSYDPLQGLARTLQISPGNPTTNVENLTSVNAFKHCSDIYEIIFHIMKSCTKD